MPKFIYAEPGYDPTSQELPMRGMTLKGCLTIVGSVLLFACVVGGGVVAALPRLIPPTATATLTSTPGPSPTPTNTATATTSSTPTKIWTPQELIIVTKLVTPTFTPVTPTLTLTPSPTQPDVVTATKFFVATNTPRPPTRTPTPKKGVKK